MAGCGNSAWPVGEFPAPGLAFFGRCTTTGHHHSKVPRSRVTRGPACCRRGQPVSDLLCERNRSMRSILALSSAASASTVPVQRVGSNIQGCTSHYELYSSHVKWVNDCPSLSELPPTTGATQ